MKAQMRVMREGQAGRLKRREKQENPTFLGKIMIIHPLAHHSRKMNKPICV